jgi:hypothetical protein
MEHILISCVKVLMMNDFVCNSYNLV